MFHFIILLRPLNLLNLLAGLEYGQRVPSFFCRKQLPAGEGWSCEERIETEQENGAHTYLLYCR